MKINTCIVSLVLAAAAWTPNGHSLDLQEERSLAVSAEQGPDKDPFHKSNYKEETKLGPIPVSVECIFATLFIALIGSVPVILVTMVGEGKLTPAHKVESGCLVLWLVMVLILFTNFLHFNSGSGHWVGARPLTIVEAVYLLAQILTTVGYGDITPAFPLSQVFVAVNVILALCLYGSIVMEVADLVTQRVEKALAQYMGSEEEETDGTSSRAAVAVAAAAEQPLVDWLAGAPKINCNNLVQSLVAFSIMIFIGTMFWHFFPGEELSWLQAIYFSIITLSTVGFGAITATTPGGMVFGAFWMLFGVATLAGVIGSFVEVMIQIKAKERANPNEKKLDFYKHVKHCCRPVQALDDQGMDSYDFMKFALLVEGLATVEEIQHIEARFAVLTLDSGKLSTDELVSVEAPPGYAEALAAGDVKPGDV